MRILVIAPNHISGTLNLLQDAIRERGHEMRYVTLFPNPWGFAEDISLDLPLMPHTEGWLVKARRLIYKRTRGPLGDDTPVEGTPPFWKSSGWFPSLFFALRDAIIAPKVLAAVREYKLDDFDVYWFDQGSGFFRDGRLAERWAKLGRGMMTYYHGSDMRTRGIFPQIDRHVQLRLTCEVDLMHLDDRLRYLFLPFDTSAVHPSLKPERIEGPVQISHAARVRAFKGTDRIIEAVNSLKQRHNIELNLIENLTHAEAMDVKRNSDIFVDQIADVGGWGYGMSSVEALSLGLPVLTRMRPEMVEFLPDHPFVNVTPDTLEDELEKLVVDSELRKKVGDTGREWVVKHHDIDSVVDQLLAYWKEMGWL